MEPLCKHFGECGGCRSQDVAYDEQLARKSETLAALFADFWRDPIPVEPSPLHWHYRNKVDFAFGRKRYPEPPPPGFVRESVLGFKARGRWFWPLNIDECRIGPEGLTPLLARVRQWMRDQGLQAFDTRSREGFLKILLVRQGVRTHQRMVVLITAEGDLDKASFVDAVRESFPADSVYRGIHRGTADVAAADEIELLDGAPAIHERLEIPDGPKLTFRISPFSFFQTNTLGTEVLYGLVRDWVRRAAPRTLYDLYGGAGGIAFSCADLVDDVISVEDFAPASEDGRFNATANNIGNVAFVTDKVERYLKPMIENRQDTARAAAIVDPPRSGLHPKALRRLVEARFPNLLYVSCKPTVLKTEMPALLAGYELINLRAVDLFPHTDHVELLASFRRQ
jgi:23S rRNA (uracil-5-)-methyltransferase RumA